MDGGAHWRQPVAEYRTNHIAVVKRLARNRLRLRTDQALDAIKGEMPIMPTLASRHENRAPMPSNQWMNATAMSRSVAFSSTANSSVI
jgi:hypothetical protein